MYCHTILRSEMQNSYFIVTILPRIFSFYITIPDKILETWGSRSMKKGQWVVKDTYRWDSLCDYSFIICLSLLALWTSIYNFILSVSSKQRIQPLLSKLFPERAFSLWNFNHTSFYSLQRVGGCLILDEFFFYSMLSETWKWGLERKREHNGWRKINSS